LRFFQIIPTGGPVVLSSPTYIYLHQRTILVA
jgi:hypothetical protein